MTPLYSLDELGLLAPPRVFLNDLGSQAHESFRLAKVADSDFFAVAANAIADMTSNTCFHLCILLCFPRSRLPIHIGLPNYRVYQHQL